MALDLVRKHWNSIKQYTHISMNEFVDALNSTYFNFQDTYYKQIHGCAMRASVSSVIAQLVLEDVEETVIKQLNTKPSFFTGNFRKIYFTTI